MKIAAIISEYNPFHYGHKYQVDMLRASGYGIIIAVMSGSVVQRGELACADKITRAGAAVECGVDIVVELPCPFSCASAEYFAYAGVFAAEALGADVLSFGSECGDISLLEGHASVENNAKAGEGAAGAELLGTDFLSNDILGIEYVRAIKRLGASITPLVHKREGGAYLSESTDTEYPSASAIRRLILEGKIAGVKDCMPEAAFSVLLPGFERYSARDRERVLFGMIASEFLYTPTDRLSSFAFLSGGLAGRMKRAAEGAYDLDDFYRLASTKVYTNGRIRRASICAVCGVEASVMKSTPEYLSLLAVSGKGREYLSSRKTEIEICTAVRQKKNYPSFEYEKRFDILFSIVCASEAGKRENYFNKSPYIHQS